MLTSKAHYPGGARNERRDIGNDLPSVPHPISAHGHNIHGLFSIVLMHHNVYPLFI